MNRKNIVYTILLLAIFVIFSGCTATTTIKTTPSNTETPISEVVQNSKTIIVNQIYEESGGVDSDGGCCIAGAGDNYKDQSTQNFLSYDITEIPANAIIVETKLDVSAYHISGDPFSTLGCLNVYQQDFGSVDPKDFFLGTPTNSLAKWCSEVDLKTSQLKSDELAKVLQSKVGQKRFEVRLQFDKSTDNNKQTDNILATYTKIIVTYVMK